jgi:hypothetical protein
MKIHLRKIEQTVGLLKDRELIERIGDLRGMVIMEHYLWIVYISAPVISTMLLEINRLVLANTSLAMEARNEVKEFVLLQVKFLATPPVDSLLKRLYDDYGKFDYQKLQLNDEIMISTRDSLTLILDKLIT